MHSRFLDVNQAYLKTLAFSKVLHFQKSYRVIGLDKKK